MIPSLPDTVDVERPAPLPDEIYVERRPLLTDFVAWAKDHAPATRLRSLVGPPGVGKTTYLHHLAQALQSEKVLLMWLDLPRGELYEYLRAWVGRQLDTLVEHGAIVLPDLSVAKLQPFWHLWPELSRTLGASPLTPILLLDGFDELNDDSRQFVEQYVLFPFLFPAVDNCQNRAVLARRDEYALNEGVLRWEDEVVWLEPLALDSEQNQPADQIGRRLAAVAGQTPGAARRILEWPSAPEAAIAYAVGLNEPGREALKTELTPALTTSPFVNVLLLQRRLQRTAALAADDFRDCLQAYLARAGLARPAEQLSAAELAQWVNNLPDPASFRFREIDLNPSASLTLKALLEDGIVAQVLGTARYRFDPAVIHLAQRIAPTSVS